MCKVKPMSVGCDTGVHRCWAGWEAWERASRRRALKKKHFRNILKLSFSAVPQERSLSTSPAANLCPGSVIAGELI